MTTTNDIVKNALAHAVARNATIRGKGRINMDDDLVIVYKPDGRVEWKGIFDDCPYKNDDMKFDVTTSTYRVNGPNGDYRIIAKNYTSMNANVEIKRKRSGVKTVVSLDEVRKGTEWGKDLTGYERNMLGRGVNELETDEYRYKVLNAVANAKFKVGDFVFDRNTHRSGTVVKVDDRFVGVKDEFTGKVVFFSNRDDGLEVRNAAPMSAHEASVLLSGKRKAVTQYTKVEPNTLYYRALGGIFAVPESDTMRSAIAAIGSRVLPYQVGGVVGNALGGNYTFKIGDKVQADRPYGIPGVIGVVKAIGLDGNLMVDFGELGTVRVPGAYAIRLNNRG